jgi:hypothetical protein
MISAGCSSSRTMNNCSRLRLIKIYIDIFSVMSIEILFEYWWKSIVSLRHLFDMSGFQETSVFFIPVFDKSMLVVFYFGTQMESKVKRKLVANFTAFSAAMCVRPCETMCFPYDAFRRVNDFKPPS